MLTIVSKGNRLCSRPNWILPCEDIKSRANTLTRGIIIFETLIVQNAPSIGETFGEIFSDYGCFHRQFKININSNKKIQVNMTVGIEHVFSSHDNTNN